MNVHRYEKIWIAASMVLIFAWIVTVTYGAVGPPGIQMIDGSGGSVDPGAIADNQFDANDNFREPGVYATDGGDVEVYVVARQFAFDPGTSEAIRVPANTRVTLYVTSPDVIHGFEVVGTNVNAMVIPGQVTRMVVNFGDPGTYGIVCNEYCGSGHHTMAGTIEVVPQSQFDAARSAGSVGAGSMAPGSIGAGNASAGTTGGEAA